MVLMVFTIRESLLKDSLRDLIPTGKEQKAA